MTRRKPRRTPLGTIWEIPDELWRRIEPILREFWPKVPTGRKVANWRKMLDAIIFRMRSGCQWDQLPERYGPMSTVHGWLQRWVEGGSFERIWAVLVAACDELGGVQWQWQAADAMLGKARCGGEKDGQDPHRPRQERDQGGPADRRRRRAAGRGDRRGEHRRAEALGGDDRGDRGRAARPGRGGATPEPGQGVRQPQWSGRGDRSGLPPHIRRIGEEQKACDRSKGHKPRRWVVERTFAWLSKCRGLLVRYEKKDGNYLGLIEMACGLLWYRRLHRMERCDATQNTT